MDVQQPTLLGLLWLDDGLARALIGLLWAVAAIAVGTVYAPLAARLRAVSLLRGTLHAIHMSTQEDIEQRRSSMSAAFEDSPLVLEWREFLRRWFESLDALPASSQSTGTEARGAVRLRDVLHERPVLPVGARSRLLGLLPHVLAGLGVACGLVAWSISGAGAAAGAACAVWGILLGLVFAVTSRVIEGGSEREADVLDRLAESAFGAVTPAELTTRAAHAQHASFDRLREEFGRANRHLSDTLDGGLRRIESSTAKAASLVAEEQRGSLRGLVEELRTSVRRGVERHLGALHDALERAVEHQDAVNGGLTQNLERMAETSASNEKVARGLEDAARAVHRASTSIGETATDLRPILDGLKQTGEALRGTAAQIDRTQQAAASTLDTVRTSLEGAADAVREQRQLVESGLGEIRSVVELLSDGLGSQLASALQNIDDVLARSVDRLRETLESSDQTIDRLAGPIRSAEDVNREMHAALERVRADVGAINRWLVDAVGPVRASLASIDEKSGVVARALHDFVQRTDSIEKTMDALRGGIGEHAGQFRASARELSGRLANALEGFETLEQRALGTPPQESRGAIGGAAEPGEEHRDAPAAASRPPFLARPGGEAEDGPPSPARAAAPDVDPRAADAGARQPQRPARRAGAAKGGGGMSALLGPSTADDDTAADGADEDPAPARSAGGEVDIDGPITYRKSFRQA